MHVSLRIHIFLGFLPGLGLRSFLLFFCTSYYKLGLVKFQVRGFIIGHPTVKDTASTPLRVASEVHEFKVCKNAELRRAKSEYEIGKLVLNRFENAQVKSELKSGRNQVEISLETATVNYPIASTQIDIGNPESQI